MAAVVTDQFRILNAGNFIDSVVDSNNAYYVFLGLDNPTSPAVGFGRTSTWDTDPPVPTDNLQYRKHYNSTSLFGKKITSSNIRRLIRKVQWTANTAYDMYRQDYSLANPAPNSNVSRLYDANYYVINSDYRVYVCISNGSSGTNPKGNKSQDEPTFTNTDPTAAGTSGDGYLWKYLFSVAPSDIIKFDATDYVVVPNDWLTTSETQIQTIREAGNSDVNNNQIKTVYIQDGGLGYSQGTTTVDIIGDGTGGRVSITVDSSTAITAASVVTGGKNYTWGVVDLGPIQPGGSTLSNPAYLIPIIPPSKGHGYDVYKELGTDKVLVYGRFDDSTKDFPTDTKFAEVGIIKNPSSFTSDSVFTENQYSSLYAVKFSSNTATPVIGEEINQVRADGKTAKAYVGSYDKDTMVLKYFQDRSLYYNNKINQTDYIGVSDGAQEYAFESSTSTSDTISFTSGGSGTIDSTFNDNKLTVGNKVIDLGVTFTKGLANPEINKKTGDIIYIDNRPLVTRDSRQKEDIKIILEF